MDSEVLDFVGFYLFYLFLIGFSFSFRAMNGSVTFQDALAARLSLFNPSMSQLQDFLQKNPPRYYCYFSKP